LEIKFLSEIFRKMTIVQRRRSQVGIWMVKSREMSWMGNVARMGERRVVYRVLVGKPEGKRPLGRPRRRREDNIKVDVQGNTRESGLTYLTVTRLGAG
jgi:hypothetical protein